MDQDVLKYGDLIILHGCLSSDQQNAPKGKRKKSFFFQNDAGFLSGLGFTDNRVFLQKVSSQKNNPLASVAELSNHKQLVFQVWPKLPCEAHKRMRKFKKERKIMGDLSEDDLQENDDIYAKLNARINEEKKSHQRIINQVMGNHIPYGNEVQFMHYNSKSFLKADVTCSNQDKSAYRFELSHEFSSRMAFRIRPKFSVRQEGEQVQFGDEVLIYSSKLDCYINFSLNNPIEIDKEMNVLARVPLIAMPFEYAKPNKESIRYEAHISQFKHCTWRMFFYGSAQDEESSMVRGGDLVYIKYSHEDDNSAYLTADICMQGPTPEVYGRLYYGEFEEEKDCVNAIWEVESDNYKDRNLPCEIVDEQKKPRHLRLRHLLTGKVLSYSTIFLEGQKWIVPVLSKSDESSCSSTVAFHPFMNNPKKELYYNTAYSLAFKMDPNLENEVQGDDGDRQEFTEAKEYRYISMEREDYTSLPETSFGLSLLSTPQPTPPASVADSGRVFKPLKEYEFATRKKLFVAESHESSAEHAFLLVKLDQQQEVDIAFVASHIPILTHFRDLLKICSEVSQIQWDVVQRVIATLKSLIFFTHKVDPKSSGDYDALTFEGPTNVGRQKLLKDFRIIELLTELLYYPFYLGLFTLQKIHDHNFQTIFQYCYRLLNHTINEYRPNELYASQWLELYMHQALVSDSVDIKAEETLTELIDNNKRILDSKINSETIREFVDSLKKCKNQKAVGLLQALIVCDGNAVLKNQTEASRLIFEHEDVKNALILNMRMKTTEVQIEVNEYSENGQPQWLTMADFYHMSQQRDQGERYNYFISLIYLFANLCLDRNYIAIEGLDSIYTSEICFNIISTEYPGTSHLWDLKAAFARLMNNLWIDRKPHHPLNLPKHIVLWDDVPRVPSSEILVANQNIGVFENLMEYLQQYFSNLAQIGCTKIYETEKNKFTLVILDLAKTLATFGFYSTAQKLKGLTQSLLVVLNGMVDVMSNKEYETFASKLQKRMETPAAVRTAFPELFMKSRSATSTSIQMMSMSKHDSIIGDNKRDPTAKFRETEETLVVMECKNKICELIKIVMTITNDINVMKFLTSFKNSTSFPESPQSPQTNRSPQRTLLHIPVDTNQIKFQSLSIIGSEDIINKQAIELKKICETDTLDITKLAPTSFSKIIYNLLRYEHKELISNAFEILCMSNSKQQCLRDTLNEVRLIENGPKRDAVMDIEEKIKKLNELAETSETWYTAKQTFLYDNQFEKCIQLIRRLGDYLVIQTDFKEHEDEEAEIIGFEEALDRYDAEEDLDVGTIDAINYEYQQILRHLKVEQALLELLKFEHSDYGKSRSDVQIKLLSEIIKFLTKFTYREKVSQSILTEHIMLFFKLLKRYPGIGLESLIAELFRNNFKILKQTDLVEKFSRNIIGFFTEKNHENYRHSRLLHNLQVLMLYKGKAIRANQIAVMSLLTMEQHAQIFFSFLTDSKKKEIKAKLEDYDRRVEKNGNDGGLVELPADIDFIISLIHVIATSSAGKNSVTESKAQSLFTIDDLSFFYEASKYCWHFKYAILSLFNHAYGDTEREIKEEINKTAKLIKSMVDDMEYLTRKQIAYRIIYHQGRIGSDMIQEFVYFQGLIPCFDEILSKRLYKNIPDHVPIFTKVLELLLKMNRKGLPKTHHRRKVRSSIDMFKIHAREIYSTLVPNSGMILESPLAMNTLQAISDNEPQESLTPLVKDENARTNYLKKIVKKFSEREDFKLSVEQEFEKTIDDLTNIEKLAENDPFSSFIPFGETVKSLLCAIDIQEDIVDKDHKLKGLRIFRKIVEIENKGNKSLAADWDTDMWIKYERKIVEQQNNLTELGLVETLFKMVSLSNDSDLQFESILVSIALLLGGNINVQKAFLECMQNDIDNSFLLGLKDLIIHNFENIKKILSERNDFFLRKAHYVMEHEKLMYANADTAKKIIEDNLLEEKDSAESLLETVSEEEYMQEVSESFLILKRIYRFLQLLCEGHNNDLQSHLLAQKNSTGIANRKSFDFISHTAFYFNVLLKQINIDSLDLSVQVLEFLIEAVQGPCVENQKALIKANIVNSSMDFMTTFKKRIDYMRRGFFSQEEMDEMDEASVKSMKLMNALIEGGISDDILEEMDGLDLRFLIEKLSAFYASFVKELKMNPETEPLENIIMKMNNDNFDQKAIESFDVYILLANLANHSDKAADLLNKTDGYDLMTQKALEFFKVNTAYIEILFKDKLIKTYFPVYPVCHHLTQDSKDKFMQNVNRSTPNDKIMGLVQATPQLVVEMEHLTHLNSQLFTFSMKRYNYLRDFSTLLSFLINIVFLSTAYYVVHAGETTSTDENIGELNTNTLKQVLSLCQLITSSLMIIFWLIINGPMIVRSKWRETSKKHPLTEEEELRLALLLEKKELGELPLTTVLNLLWRKGPYDPIFYQNGRRNLGHPYVWMVWLYKNLLFISSEGMFLFIIFYFVVSVLGYTVSEITYCLHLLDVINRFGTLRNVIRAVTYNIRQLMLTAFLGLVLIYIYTLVGFIFLDDFYYDKEINERTCTSMIHCYMYTISFGLRFGGGIGEVLQKPSFAEGRITAYVFRFFFDVSFFIIINIVFLNIIFGIIIDTFAELRDEKKSIDEDMQNKCYICNIERFTLDKDGGGFKHHIMNDHFLWNYVFFIYSVNSKDPTEYNGIESYVKQKLEDEDISWFPLQRAMVFGSTIIEE